jgi:hypothetical protein
MLFAMALAGVQGKSLAEILEKVWLIASFFNR